MLPAGDQFVRICGDTLAVYLTVGMGCGDDGCEARTRESLGENIIKNRLQRSGTCGHRDSRRKLPRRAREQFRYSVLYPD